MMWTMRVSDDKREHEGQRRERKRKQNERQRKLKDKRPGEEVDLESR